MYLCMQSGKDRYNYSHNECFYHACVETVHALTYTFMHSVI